MMPSECQMGGVAIQLLRVLGLQKTFAECVISKAYRDLKKFKDVADIVMNERYWDLHYAVCKGLYHAYLLLWCADQKLGGMDRVKYLMMQITRLLPKACDEIVEKWDSLGEDNLKLIHCAKSDFEFDTPKMMGGLKTEGLGDGELGALQLFLLVELQPNPCFTSFQMIGILTVMMMMNQVCLQVVTVSPLLSLFLKEFLSTLLLMLLEVSSFGCQKYGITTNLRC